LKTFHFQPSLLCFDVTWRCLGVMYSVIVSMFFCFNFFFPL
jgi:hypothetical protein